MSGKTVWCLIQNTTLFFQNTTSFSKITTLFYPSHHAVLPFSPPVFSLLTTFLHHVKNLSQKKILIPNFVTTFAPKV
jgi:hypothetical protein